MSHVGNLPDTADLARAPAGRRCARCRAVLSTYTRGTVCAPCREAETGQRLDRLCARHDDRVEANRDRCRTNARDRKRRRDDGDPAEVERIRAEIRRIEEKS